MTAELCKNECQNCDGGCPNNTICRLDESANETLTKNRAISRNRHHSGKKEKIRQKESAHILESKAKRIPDSAPLEQLNRADKRVIKAYKRNPELHVELKEKRAELKEKRAASKS